MTAIGVVLEFSWGGLADVLNGVVGTLLATAVVAVLVWMWASLRSRCERISGKWWLIANTEHTTYRPYEGMELTYEVMLEKDGLKLSGRGEKIRERVADGKTRDYVGAKRVHIEISGRIARRLVGKGTAEIHIHEQNSRRASTTLHNVTLDREMMSGEFVSTVAGQKGRVLWTRSDPHGGTSEDPLTEAPLVPMDGPEGSSGT